MVRGPIRLLVVVVIIDVLIGAVLRIDLAADLLSGRRDWRSWLGLLAALYLLVVVYALALVTRSTAAMRKALRRRDDALAAHARTTNDWLWETTPDLVITYCAGQVEELMGYAPQELIGRSAHEFMTPPTARRSRQALASGLARDGWQGVRSEWVHADGHVVPMLHSGAPITDDSGTLLGYRGTGTSAPAADDAARHLSALRDRIASVIAEGRVTMALQPIINVQTGRMVGAEALARFDDGRPPDVWFEEAGRVGLRTELEMLAVSRALDRLRELPADATISINACPEVLLDPAFQALMLSGRVPLSRVVLEITEHIRILDYDALQTSLDLLRAAGVTVAVDDAGAGYASLGHVLRLRPDHIKLDRSIVAGIDTDRARRTLITALVLLALEINASVTAEGIETAAELEAVAALGVDLAQGYLIARPTTDISTWPPSFLARPAETGPR